MIKNILDLLSLNDYFGETEIIEVAKGKYELKDSIKESFKQGKRLGYGTK